MTFRVDEPDDFGEDDIELPYYCSSCYAVLEHCGMEEEYCKKCGKSIETPNDYLTHDQWADARNRDRIAWDDAQRDGLIK